MSNTTQIGIPRVVEGTYTALDLARMLQCSVRHVRNLDERRAIPGRLTFGRLVRFSKQQVDQWLVTKASCS